MEAGGIGFHVHAVRDAVGAPEADGVQANDHNVENGNTFAFAS